MGMAAFRINEEERLAREAGSAEKEEEVSAPEPEEPKATTVTAKKPASKG